MPAPIERVCLTAYLFFSPFWPKSWLANMAILFVIMGDGLVEYSINVKSYKGYH